VPLPTDCVRLQHCNRRLVCLSTARSGAIHIAASRAQPRVCSMPASRTAPRLLRRSLFACIASKRASTDDGADRLPQTRC
jgi:hypothetical protein